ncbi:MAG: DUF1285 domain-containing protein [Halieaceae bacterium]|jgi:hypothetical protein|nr:DUF1285 domain-containing protein [Halieaceae bacterium]
MTTSLERLQQAIPATAASLPPVHLWQPELSGDIDIEIRRDGSWWHEGAPIKRQSLVKLFASILRRESDGYYYLVTPVEKWRVRVQSLPLLVVDFSLEQTPEGDDVIVAKTNTQRSIPVCADYPLFFTDALDEDEPTLAIGLENGLAAQFTRAAWYRLVEASEERDGQHGIESAGLFFPLEA